MEDNNIIAAIMGGCQCSEEQAREYLQGEVANLQDLARIGDLRTGDMENACDSVGIEYDFVPYFAEQVGDIVPECLEEWEDEDDAEYAEFTSEMC